MSDHVPFNANHDPSRNAGTDTSPDDVDALDLLLNGAAASTGWPATRPMTMSQGSNLRMHEPGATREAEDLAAVATSFHRRIDGAQSARPGASAPDPHLWETIMQVTSPGVATASPTSRVPPTSVRPESARKRAIPFPGSRRPPVWALLANVALILAVLAAGFGAWRASGGFGIGDAPDGSRLGVLWSDATPADGFCPPVSNSEGDANPDDFTNAAGLRVNLYACVDEFEWPTGFEPDLEAIAGRWDNNGDNRIDPGAARSMLGSINQCAWSITWLESRAGDDSALEAEALHYLTEVIPGYPDLGIREVRTQLGADAAAGDSSSIEQYVSINCFPLDWTTHDATPPASENIATPDAAATPVAASGCDLSGTIPVFQNANPNELVDTLLNLTAQRELVLSCDNGNTQVTLARDVLGVSTTGWPGVLCLALQPAQIDTPRNALLNITTGEMVELGIRPERMKNDIFFDDGSPWIVAPDAADPNAWAIIDARTMESRLLASYLTLDAPVPGESSSDIAVSTNGPGSMVAVAAVDHPEGVIFGPALILDGSLKNSRVVDLPQGVEGRLMSLAPNGEHLVITGMPSYSGDESMHLVVSTVDGAEIARSGVVNDYSLNPIWAQGGKSLVYADQATVYRMSMEGDTAPIVLLEDEDPSTGRFQELWPSYDPDVVITSRVAADDLDDEEEHTVQPRIHAINAATGDVLTFEGVDASHNISPWTLPTRYIARYQPPAESGPVTLQIFDVITSELYGEIPGIPYDTGSGFATGPSSVTSSLDGSVEVMAFGADKIYVVHEENGEVVLDHLATPEGMAVTSGYVSISLSDSGSHLAVSGQSEDGQNCWWMIDLTNPDATWQAIEGNPGANPGHVFFLEGIEG